MKILLNKYLIYSLLINIFCKTNCFGSTYYKNYEYNILESAIESNDSIHKRYNCGFENLILNIKKLSTSYFTKSNDVLFEEEKTFIETIPNELIDRISGYLDLYSVIKLSHTSIRFKTFFNDDFWKKYNIQHNYQVFKDMYSFSSIFNFNQKKMHSLKITLANHYFYIGKNFSNKNMIKKASFLGLPKATNYLLLNKIRKDRNDRRENDIDLLEYSNFYERSFREF